MYWVLIIYWYGVCAYATRFAYFKITYFEITNFNVSKIL